MKHSGKHTTPARSMDACAMTCSANATDSSGVAGKGRLASAIRKVLIQNPDFIASSVADAPGVDGVPVFSAASRLHRSRPRVAVCYSMNIFFFTRRYIFLWHFRHLNGP